MSAVEKALHTMRVIFSLSLSPTLPLVHTLFLPPFCILQQSLFASISEPWAFLLTNSVWTDVFRNMHAQTDTRASRLPPCADITVVNSYQRGVQERRTSLWSARRRTDLTVLIWLFVCLPVDSVLQQVIILDRDPGACVLLQLTITATLAAVFVSLIVLLKEPLLHHYSCDTEGNGKQHSFVESLYLHGCSACKKKQYRKEGRRLACL